MSEAPDTPVSTLDPTTQRTLDLAQAVLQTAQAAQAQVAQIQAANPAKPWYKSKGMVGSLVASSAASLMPTVLAASRADAKTTVIAMTSLALVSVLGSMFGAIGRATASQPVK